MKFVKLTVYDLLIHKFGFIGYENAAMNIMFTCLGCFVGDVDWFLNCRPPTNERLFRICNCL